MALADLWATVIDQITRSKVKSARMGSVRTELGLESIEGESLRVALLLPFGMSAIPSAGADCLTLVCNGHRDHKVALFADAPGLRIVDLKAGEFGFRDANGSTVVWRENKLQITAKKPLEITLTEGAPVTIKADHVTVESDDVRLGGAGGKKVVVDGDPVIGGGGGHVQASTAKVWAQ